MSAAGVKAPAATSWPLVCWTTAYTLLLKPAPGSKVKSTPPAPSLSTMLKVALLIGTLLNLINQGDALFTGTPVNWWKFALTFAMPYAVSTYGAVSLRLAQERHAGR